MKRGLLLKIGLPIAAIAAGVVYFANTLIPTALVEVVYRGVAPNAVPGTVQVLAEKETYIRSEEQGRIAWSGLQVGGQAKRGETLVELDTGDLAIAIEKENLDLAAARRAKELGSSQKFALEEAKKQLATVEQDLEAGIASPAQVESRRREVERIEKTIEGETIDADLKIALIENTLKGLRRQQEKMSIKSPIDGIVAEVLAYEGDLISPEQSIARVVSLNHIVEVKVSEENFAGLELGQSARIKFLGYGDEVFSGSVSRVIPVADAETQRYSIHLDVDIPRERLFVGLTGEANITLDERKEALIIPLKAVQGSHVYLVQDDVVTIRDVVKGYSSLSSIEIRSGVEEGQFVIVENLELFREGDRVKVLVNE